jgi:hypothetical protein
MSQGRSESRDSVHLEHSLVETASSVDVDDSLVVSEAQVPVVANSDEALDNVEVAQAAEAVQGAENDWSTIQADALYVEHMDVEDLPLVDPMVIDPWWWQGVVTFEYTPETMDIDVPVEGGLGGADFDQPAQVMGAFLQEHSDRVVCEDILMEYAYPQGIAEPIVQENNERVACEDILMEYAYPQGIADPTVQNHMDPQVHSNRGVDSNAYVADTVTTEATGLEGASSVISARAPETREEGDVVSNRGSSVNPPTLPSTEVAEEEEEEVLEQTPVQNQGSAEGHSGSAGSSRSVEQHPTGCQCATCAAVARDLEEVRRVFDQFEEEEEEDEEEQESAREEALVLRNRTGGRSRLLGRR